MDLSWSADMLPCQQPALYSSTPTQAYEAAVQALLVPVQDSLAAMTSQDAAAAVVAATTERVDRGCLYSHTVTIGRAAGWNSWGKLAGNYNKDDM